MIKKFKSPQGAIELANNPNIIVENGLLSNSYFSTVYGLNELSIGKNALRIVLSDNVVPTAKLLVDIVDSEGNLIYYETMNYLPNDRSTIISVYIYDDTANGPATIYIGGRALRDIYTDTLLTYSQDSTSPDYYDIPNMLFVGQLNINNNRINQSEIIYLRPPQASVNEVTRTFNDPSTSSTPRLNVNSGSGQLLSQRVSNYSKDTNITTIDQLESTIVGAEPIVEKQFDTGLLLDPLLTSDTKQGNEAKSIYIEDFNSLPVIVSDNAYFEKDMVGGTIVFNNIDTASLVPAGATILGQYQNGTYVQSNSYTASIIEVINSKNAIVNAPFQLYYTFDSIDVNNLSRSGIANNVALRSTRAFSNFSNFTASYIQRVTNTTNTESSQSYANFIINNLDPSTGTIYKVQTLYKPYGTFGNYIDLGYHELNSYNLLSDTASLVPDPYEGQKELPIGEFVSQSIADNYWQLSQVNLGAGISPTLEVSDTSNAKLIYGVTITTGSKAFNDVLQTEQNASAVYITHNATINVTTDTQYTVKFNAFSTTSDIIKTSQYPKPVIDVYISGSSIETDLLRTSIDTNNITSNSTNTIYDTLTNQIIPLGTLIGTIKATGLFLNNGFNFKAIQNGNVKLLFVVRSGEWTLSDIEIATDYTLGYTPNYTNYKVRIPAVYYNTQLEFLLRYYNENGTIAPVKSRLSGVKFIGNNQYVGGNNNLLPGRLNLGTAAEGGVSLDGNTNTVSTYGYTGGAGWTMWSGSRDISGSLQSGSGFFFETGAPNNQYFKAVVGGKIESNAFPTSSGDPIDTGSFVKKDEFYQYTSSVQPLIDQIPNKLDKDVFYSYTSSNDIAVGNKLDKTIFYNFTGSYNNDSASFDIRINNKLDKTVFNSYTSSTDTRIKALLKGVTNLNSTLTFTKDDDTTFDVTTATDKVSAGLFNAFTESINNKTGSFLKTGSVSLNTLTFTKDDGSTFSLTVDTGSGTAGTINTGSFVLTSSFNPFTESINLFTQSYYVDSASFDTRINNIPIVDTGSFVTTSSLNDKTGSFVLTSSFNAFTGSVVTTSSFNTYTGSVTSALNGKANLNGGNSFTGDQRITNGYVQLDSGSNQIKLANDKIRLTDAGSDYTQIGINNVYLFDSTVSTTTVISSSINIERPGDSKTTISSNNVTTTGTVVSPLYLGSSTRTECPTGADTVIITYPSGAYSSFIIDGYVISSDRPAYYGVQTVYVIQSPVSAEFETTSRWPVLSPSASARPKETPPVDEFFNTGSFLVQARVAGTDTEIFVTNLTGDRINYKTIVKAFTV